MNSAAAASTGTMRILYSFPHRLGLTRICSTAWHQVDSIAMAGAEVMVLAGDAVRRFQHPNTRVVTTLGRGRLRLPYRVLGTRRMCILHDWIVSRQLARCRQQVDIVHAWPLGALRTIRVARSLGIPVVLERCNAHTRFAYQVVQRECERLGIHLPKGHEHAHDRAVLRREEAEYQEADALLCPSEFVARTFREMGFPRQKLSRHQYGYDPRIFHARGRDDNGGRPFTALFVGGCAPRKGLHYALEAWLRSGAHENGQLLIAGAFVPGYRELLSDYLSHPSVRVLGHRSDVAELMRGADVLLLPSVEEGSALVTYEARASGCVLLVSEAAGAVCRDGEEGYIHSVGDVTTLARQLTHLHNDPNTLRRRRLASLATAHELTWEVAGRRLVAAYRNILGAACSPA